MSNQQTYKPRLWVPFVSNMPVLIFLSLGLFMLWYYVPQKTPDPGMVTIGCITFILLLFFLFPFYRYCTVINKVLILSFDDNVFYFGDKGNEVNYKKSDVAQLLIYQPGGMSGKRVHEFYVYEIYFKNGTKIKFSNFFISEEKMIGNFSVDLIRYSSKYTFFRL